MNTLHRKARALAAAIALLAGAGMAAAPWLLAADPAVLRVALCGAVYLLLALGLMGSSRFSLFLGVAIPFARAWFRLWPAPDVTWELLRTGADVALLLLCGFVGWSAVHPDYAHRGAPSSASTDEQAGTAVEEQPDEPQEATGA